MNRAALVLDVHNLYVNSVKKYSGKVVNYGDLLEELTANQGYDLFHRIAYGKQPVEKCRQFATMLQRSGFELHFGNTPHQIAMSLRIADLIKDRALDTLILGTNYFEAGRILKYARSKGIYTMAIGFDLPPIFEQYAYLLEIQPHLLQEKSSNEATETLDVYPDSIGDLEQKAA